MAITNGYCTLAEIKAALRITDSTDNTLLEQAVEAASRRIDGYTGRFFYQQSATATFYCDNSYALAIPDLVSVTTLKTDDNGDGTYETTWTAGTDYVLNPTDVSRLSRPYRRVVASGGKTFPLASIPALALAQIVGVWGWPAVPHDIREAAILLSSRQFARYNAALGVVGFADMAVQVRAVDPDVRDLLNPYRLFGVS